MWHPTVAFDELVQSVHRGEVIAYNEGKPADADWFIGIRREFDASRETYLAHLNGGSPARMRPTFDPENLMERFPSVQGIETTTEPYLLEASPENTSAVRNRSAKREAVSQAVNALWGSREKVPSMPVGERDGMIQSKIKQLTGTSHPAGSRTIRRFFKNA